MHVLQPFTHFSCSQEVWGIAQHRGREKIIESADLQAWGRAAQAADDQLAKCPNAVVLFDEVSISATAMDARTWSERRATCTGVQAELAHQRILQCCCLLRVLSVHY